MKKKSKTIFLLLLLLMTISIYGSGLKTDTVPRLPKFDSVLELTELHPENTKLLRQFLVQDSIERLERAIIDSLHLETQRKYDIAKDQSDSYKRIVDNLEQKNVSYSGIVKRQQETINELMDITDNAESQYIKLIEQKNRQLASLKFLNKVYGVAGVSAIVALIILIIK